MQALIDESEALAQKQSLAEMKTSHALDQLIIELEKKKLEISNGNAVDASSLRIEGDNLFSQAQSAVKAFHIGISKLGKTMEKEISMEMDDPCKGLSIKLSSPSKDESVNLIICEHLCREGRIEIAETFAKEVGISEEKLTQMKEPYYEIHRILSGLAAMDLSPAAEWALSHRPGLPHKANSDPSGPSLFEFRLLQLEFVSVLKAQGRDQALAFARAKFEPFAQAGYPVHRLMGLLVVGTTDAAQRRYPDLLSPSAWQEAADEFASLACGLMGQSKKPPLLVAVAAGSVALPPLLKLSKVMEQSSFHGSMSELPVELDLGMNEFIFHSIFSCPVSKEQSTADNPPCLLPCGHLLCLESIQRIVRARTRTFKCPYCPSESKIDGSLLKIVL